jgi:hypothetical protein
MDNAPHLVGQLHGLGLECVRFVGQNKQGRDRLALLSEQGIKFKTLEEPNEKMNHTKNWVLQNNTYWNSRDQLGDVAICCSSFAFSDPSLLTEAVKEVLDEVLPSGVDVHLLILSFYQVQIKMVFGKTMAYTKRWINPALLAQNSALSYVASDVKFFAKEKKFQSPGNNPNHSPAEQYAEIRNEEKRVRQVQKQSLNYLGVGNTRTTQFSPCHGYLLLGGQYLVMYDLNGSSDSDTAYLLKHLKPRRRGRSKSPVARRKKSKSPAAKSKGKRKISKSPPPMNAMQKFLYDQGAPARAEAKRLADAEAYRQRVRYISIYI